MVELIISNLFTVQEKYQPLSVIWMEQLFYRPSYPVICCNPTLIKETLNTMWLFSRCKEYTTSLFRGSVNPPPGRSRVPRLAPGSFDRTSCNLTAELNKLTIGSSLLFSYRLFEQPDRLLNLPECFTFCFITYLAYLFRWACQLEWHQSVHI